MVHGHEPTQLFKHSILNSLQIFLRDEFIRLTEVLKIICALYQCLLNLHTFLGVKISLIKSQSCLLIHFNQGFNAVSKLITAQDQSQLVNILNYPVNCLGLTLSGRILRLCSYEVSLDSILYLIDKLDLFTLVGH